MKSHNSLPSMQNRMMLGVAKTWLRQKTGRPAETWLVGDVWVLELEGFPDEQFMLVDVYSVEEILKLTIEYR